MQNLYWIRTKVRGYDGKRVTFNPNQFQRAKYNLVYIDQKRRLIELKSRKFGTTTGWCIDSLDEAAFGKRFFQAVTMAHSSDKSTEIFNDIVKFAWDRVSEGIRPKEKYNTKTMIDLSASRGSKYVVTNDVKGATPNRLHITEAAYFKNDEAIIEALNALPDEATGIVESTANGVGNWFETIFTEAWTSQKAGKAHKWHAIFHPWFDDPNNRVTSTEGRELRYEDEARELQEKFGLEDSQIFWWDEKKQDNRDLVYQFYPSTPEEAFIHSGRPVFDLVHLRDMQERFAREPIRVENEIQIWEEPDPDAAYGIGVDPAEGKEDGDNSVVSVVRRDDGREVAQVAGKIPMHQLAEKLAEVCRMYREHLAVIERNNHGHTVIAYAKEFSEITLYQRSEIDKITERTSTVIGWDTNERSKAYAINSLSRDLDDVKCVPQSPETFAELFYYVYGDRGIMGAMQGKHDDRVMALSLANLACHEMILVGSLHPSDYGIV